MEFLKPVPGQMLRFFRHEKILIIRRKGIKFISMNINLFTGVPFDNDRNTEITMDDVNAYMATLSPEESAQMQAMTSGMSDDQILQLFSASLKARTTDATLDSNKSKLGITDLDTPSQIDIYATDFDSKEKVQNLSLIHISEPTRRS